jgi:hypothetical protein
VTFSFRPSSFDPDGDPLLFSVQNRPAWMSLDFRTGELSGVPGIGDIGISPGIVISVSDNKATVSLEAFTVTVVPPSNRPPTIAGSPSTTAIVGQAYVFQASGADPDADRLVYDIVDKPRWAEFDTATGRLQGTPTTADVGSTGAISIGVSDGRLRTTLEVFSILVQPIIPPAPAASSAPGAAEPQGPASSPQLPSPTSPSPPTSTPPETARRNRAPSISGAPMTSITVGSAYAFVPVATDADGDRLTFSILNRPAWASFDQDLDGARAVARPHLVPDQRMRHAVVVPVDLEVVVEGDPHRLPLGVDVRRRRQRAHRRTIQCLEHAQSAPGQLLEGARVQVGEQRHDRLIELPEAEEAMVTQPRQDPALDQLHRQLRLRLVLRAVGARRDHHRPVVPRQFLVRALQLRLVPIRLRDADPRVVRHHDLRARPVVFERPHVRAQPVRQRLGARRFGKGSVRRPTARDSVKQPVDVS